MEKRLLTQSEKNRILNSITPSDFLPNATFDSVSKILRDNLRKQLKGIKIFPHLIGELGEKIHHQYQKTRVAAGETVGIVMAQSIGERQTQLTLNTFHRAGLSSATVISGVPRFSELLNATKNPKAASCEIKLTETCDSIAKARDLGSRLIETFLKDVVKDFSLLLAPQETWYSVYREIYQEDFQECIHCIRCVVNFEVIFQRQLSLEEISSKIELAFDDVKCIAAPLEKGIIDLFFPFDEDGDEKESLENYYNEVMLPSLKQIVICGVRDIKNIFFQENEDGNWHIVSQGSNFQVLAGLPEIDFSSLVSNNMWEIYNCLGVEATRTISYSRIHKCRVL